MKINYGKMRVSLLALAVQGALISMCPISAHADDEEVAALKNPTNTIEIGAENVSQSSAKFGEYDGLNKSGGKVIGNFSVRGGDAYGDSNGTRNWSLNGSNLGTTSRALGASVGNQGSWSFGVGYDELQHNLWDTYKTPYQGSMGGNTFTLPAAAGFPFSTAAGVAVAQGAPTNPPTGTDGAANLASINAALHQVDVYSTRKNGKVSAGVNLNAQWDVRFDFNRLEQSGAKLAGFGSMANAISAAGVTGEAISILPNPTNYKTDTFNLALNWKGDQSHVSTSYLGSFFHEGYDRINFQTFAGTASVNQIMSTAPSNQFHQLNLNGGYDFTSATKLTGGLSYGRNTQNDAYVADAYSMVTAAPMASLNGLVNTTHADMKLTNQTSKDMVLSAGMKYDERRDKTASNFYRFNALDGAASHIANFANTPLSLRKTQWELAGNYRIDSDQHLLLAYNREDIRRWCDQYAVGGLGAYAALPAPYTATSAGVNSYPAGTNCVVATGSYENKLGATYKLRASEDLNLNAGYSFSKRVTTSDPNAITARIGLNGNPNLANTGAGNTLIQGLNAGDYRGFYPVFDASRKEQMLKAGANWQASEKFSVALGGKYTDDRYDSTYGEQKGNSWSMNLDTDYGYSKNSSIVAYVTQQHRQREMMDLYRSPTAAPTAAGPSTLNVPSGATWTDTQKDDDTTIGVGAKQHGMMASRLELDEDLTYTYGKTVYTTVFNYAAATTGAGGLPVYTCASPQFLTCGSLPEVNNHMIQFKLSGKYKLDKNSKIAVGYIYQHMKSADYYYNGLQAGSTPSALMPTYQQAPSYTNNVIIASYILNF
jgi:MtrB/PioB family decaheme-associated outer membrane protein